MTNEETLPDWLRQQCGHDSRSVPECGHCDAADEIERLREVLKSVQDLAGGHAIECQCVQCQIFELLEPIVGNTSSVPAHEPLHVASFPVALTQPTLDALIAEADRYILPVDVKMGAATFRKGVNVGTMLRGLKVHAERQTATVFSQGASRDASSEKSSVCQCPEEFCANEMADSGFGVVNATGPCRKRAAKRT